VVSFNPGLPQILGSNKGQNLVNPTSLVRVYSSAGVSGDRQRIVGAENHLTLWP